MFSQIELALIIFKLLKFLCFLTYCLDKKNENKEVAVNEFLPPATAVEAIQHSMLVYIEKLIYFIFLSCIKLKVTFIEIICDLWTKR